MAEESGADIDVEVAGQRVNVKNVKSLNTILTLLSFVGICLLMYGGYMHANDDRSMNKAFVDALTGLTQATREQNCLLRFDQKDRQANADFCKTIAR